MERFHASRSAIDASHKLRNFEKELFLLGAPTTVQFQLQTYVYISSTLILFAKLIVIIMPTLWSNVHLLVQKQHEHRKQCTQWSNRFTHFQSDIRSNVCFRWHAKGCDKATHSSI